MCGSTTKLIVRFNGFILVLIFRDFLLSIFGLIFPSEKVKQTTFIMILKFLSTLICLFYPIIGIIFVNFWFILLSNTNKYELLPTFSLPSPWRESGRVYRL